MAEEAEDPRNLIPIVSNTDQSLTEQQEWRKIHNRIGGRYKRRGREDHGKDGVSYAGRK
jgi:hypothetical protein